MEVEAYLRRSRVFRDLRGEQHGQHIERFAARLVEIGIGRQGVWRSLNVVGGFLRWIERGGRPLADVDERSVERYLRSRARRQSIQPGDRAALMRWLAVLRDGGAIAQAVLPVSTPHERIFLAFADYLRTERGLVPTSIVRHLPVIRQFLQEVCPAGDDDLGKFKQDDVIRYVERHARDWSPKTGKTMCWSLRAFLRYLHHRGLNPRSLVRIPGKVTACSCAW